MCACGSDEVYSLCYEERELAMKTHMAGYHKSAAAVVATVMMS